MNLAGKEKSFREERLEAIQKKEEEKWKRRSLPSAQNEDGRPGFKSMQVILWRSGGGVLVACGVDGGHIGDPAGGGGEPWLVWAGRRRPHPREQQQSCQQVFLLLPIKPSAFLWLNVLSWLASVPKSLTKFNLSPTPTPPTATTTPTTPWWWWSPGASWTCQAKSGKEERWLGFGATENNSSFRFLITHRHIYHVHDGDDGDEDDNNIIIMILYENPRPTKRSWTRVRWSWLKPRLGKHSTARCADWSQEQHLR